MKAKMVCLKHEGITILHILPDLFSSGGTPRKLLSIVQNSDKKKFCHIFLLFCNHADNLADAMRSAGGIVEEVVRRENMDIRLLLDIIQMTRKFNINIINTHFARADIYGLLAGVLCGIPVIKSVHGIFWNNSMVIRYFDRLMAPLRYLTICNSRATLLAEEKRSHVKKRIFIHNGVEPRTCNHFCEEAISFRDKIGIPPNSFFIGHVGGLIPLRRQDLILDAVSIIRENKIDIYCAIAGKGPEEINLHEHAKYLKITERIKFWITLRTLEIF